MSRFLSSVAQTEFDSEVKHAYQKAGLLRGTVTLRTGVTGDTYKFRLMGKGLAQQRPASSSDVTPMDINHSQPQATLTNWYAPEYTDIFDKAEVNFDEQRELAQTIAGALGRREDQLILDAIDDATGIAGTVSEDIGGTNSKLNTAKVRRASRFLNAKGVPNSERYLVHTAGQLEDMLASEEATSSDFNSVKALVNGELNTFVGFKWILIEDRAEGGIRDESSEDRAFAYHKMAVGHAVGLDIRQETNYIPEKVSWLANGILKAGAVTRDPEGIVEIENIETT
jgi:hypothetical protein